MKVEGFELLDSHWQIGIRGMDEGIWGLFVLAVVVVGYMSISFEQVSNQYSIG